MTIINKSTTMDEITCYNITKAPGMNKLRDVVGQTIDIKYFCLYEDVTQKGEVQSIIGIMTREGERYGSNSPTVIKNFTEIYEIFSKGDHISVEICTAKSKNGRDYLYLLYKGDWKDEIDQ